MPAWNISPMASHEESVITIANKKIAKELNLFIMMFCLLMQKFCRELGSGNLMLFLFYFQLQEMIAYVGEDVR